MILFIIFILCAITRYGVYMKELTDVIQTDKGPIQGEIYKTIRKSIEFSSFRGIPYGKPPIGHLRFKPPEEAEPWKNIFNATVEGTPCPQFNFGANKTFTNEDCLNLNVYSPKTNFKNTNDNLLPVMVWIYGGGFTEGSTDMRIYGPDFLIENGVVVVAMNYRLGILGFLSLNLPNATGNAGLKDQQLALKWVKKNIKVFGGDPDSVTIFGQSAGAACVDYHTIVDGSQGLFHRSISISGSVLSTWAFSTAFQAEERAFYLASLLGIKTTNKEQLLMEFYNQSAYNLVMAATKMFLGDLNFKPTLEDTKIAGDLAFLSECSLKKYKSGNFSHVPHITGFMASEALLFFSNVMLVKYVIYNIQNQIQQCNDKYPLDIILSYYDIELDSITTIDDLNINTFQGLVNLLSNIIIVNGVDIKQRYLAKYSNAPVYYYRNSFAPYPSVHRSVYGIDRYSATHNDDLALFWYLSIVNFPTHPEDPFVIMQERITRMWTNFAKYSNPTPFGINDSLLNITWPISGLSGEHLEIDYNFTTGKRPIDSITKLIQDILKLYLNKLFQC